LKWLSPEHIYFTADGRLIIGSLAGAELVTYNNDESGDKNKKEKRKRDSLQNEEDFPKIVPKTCLHLVAPEIILGGAADAQSSIYCVGSLAMLLLSGKSLVKVNLLIIRWLYRNLTSDHSY
jgi:hypothetical protein